MRLKGATGGKIQVALVVKNPPANAGDMRQGFNPLEKEMAACSSILAWEIPWTEKPGGLHSMGVTKSWTRLKQLSM